MKKFTNFVLIGILLFGCCSSSSNSENNKVGLPDFTKVARSPYGDLYKYKDGYNTIYLYEPSTSSGGVITVVRD